MSAPEWEQYVNDYYHGEAEKEQAIPWLVHREEARASRIRRVQKDKRLPMGWHYQMTAPQTTQNPKART